MKVPVKAPVKVPVKVPLVYITYNHRCAPRTAAVRGVVAAHRAGSGGPWGFSRGAVGGGVGRGVRACVRGGTSLCANTRHIGSQCSRGRFGKDLLPVSTDLVRAALAFETTLPVLKHSVNAIKAWHRWLGLPVPVDGPGEYGASTAV